MKITETKFEITRERFSIKGIGLHPEGNCFPVAVVSHGFLSRKEDVLGYTRMLAECGYAAYCFDFAGGGTDTESDGELREMTVLTEKADLLAVIDYVTALPYTNSEQVVLMGCSQGGFVSAMVAAELRDKVSRLVLFYPALCIPDDARRGKMLMFSFDPHNLPEEIRAGSLSLGADYVRTAMEMDAYEEIKGYDGKVLIIHGDDDGAVPLCYSEKAQELYGGRCTLSVIHGAGHGFNQIEDTTAISEVKKFLGV